MAEVKYTETEANEDDPQGRMLYALANGQPYAFVVATSVDPLHLRVASEINDVDELRALLTQTLRALPGGAKAISDGYHTIGDLYDHRRALTAALMRLATTIWGGGLPVWRSKEHHPEDGPMFEGSFIVGIKLPTGMVTYHYNLEDWDDFSEVPVLPHAEKWDGAGPDETVARFLEYARSPR
jgi:hypothetical protein